MLTDEEIIDMAANMLPINSDHTIAILRFAKALERAVLAKAGGQEPIASRRKDFMGNYVYRNEAILGNELLYAHPLPAQAIPEGYQLAAMEPTASMLDAGVAMALQVSVHGEGGWSKYLSGLYKQMLSASPKP